MTTIAQELEMNPKEKIAALAADLGLTIATVFIPWSKSRNKGEKNPSLNWLVTLKRNGAAVLSVDYGAGCAHCPSYKSFNELVTDRERVKWECENGHAAIWSDSQGGAIRRPGSKPLQPDLCDVLYSLSMDADALNFSDYEDFAENFGYDKDSRKGEKIYQECLRIGLKLRSAIGETGLRKLQEACQDY